MKRGVQFWVRRFMLEEIPVRATVAPVLVNGFGMLATTQSNSHSSLFDLFDDLTDHIRRIPGVFSRLENNSFVTRLAGLLGCGNHVPRVHTEPGELFIRGIETAITTQAFTMVGKFQQCANVYNIADCFRTQCIGLCVDFLEILQCQERFELFTCIGHSVCPAFE